MTDGQFLYLLFVLGGFTFFGVSLAYFRWEYVRDRRRATAAGVPKTDANG
jgi:hypothetical protein